jgi:hypothetical protein
MGKDTYKNMTPTQRTEYNKRCMANRKARAAKAAEKGEELLCSQAGTLKPLAAFTETLRDRLNNPRLFLSDVDPVKFSASATPEELLMLVKKNNITLPTVSDAGLQSRKKYWSNRTQEEKDQHYGYCNQRRYDLIR